MEIERWVIGECILKMLSVLPGITSRGGSERPGFFMNECHPSSMVTILVGMIPKLTQEFICEVQRILEYAQTVSQVNLEFEDMKMFPGSPLQLRGLEVTVNRSVAYKGSKLPKNASGSDTVKFLPCAPDTVRQALRQIASGYIERVQKSVKMFSDQDVWRRLVRDVEEVLESCGLHENVQYEIVPFVEDVRVIALIVEDVSQVTPAVTRSLQEMMMGKNPWEIFLSDKSRDGALVLVVSDGDVLNCT